MAGQNDEYMKLFRLQYEMIDHLKAESMATQCVLTGLMKELCRMPEGQEMIRAAFDYATDQAIPVATSKGPGDGHAALAVGMLDHWRKMLKI